MALLNQNSLLFYDSKGNIHHFLEGRGTVEYIYWDKRLKKGSEEVFCDGVKEIKGWMEPDDTIYLFCLSTEEEIIFYEIKNNTARKKIIERKEKECDIRDIALYTGDGEIYLLYTCRAGAFEQFGEPLKMNRRRLIRLAFSQSDLKDNEMGFERRTLLEFMTGILPSEVIARAQKENTYITVVEKLGDRSSIIILKQNFEGSVDGIVKVTMYAEIFWYDVYVNENSIFLTYTVREQGMFSIRYSIYDQMTGRLTEEISVREKSSGTHPIFVAYKGDLWLCWFENGSVNSCILKEDEISEGPIKWKDSVGHDILLNEFYVNDLQLKEKADFDCRKVFCIYPENNITGFGKDTH